MDERERFEALLEVLDALAEANERTPILVEGKRDVASLRAIGCTGDIIPVHNGNQLFNLAEDLGRVVEEVILLTDWDRRGVIILESLQAGLEANGVRVDLLFRERIRTWGNSTIKDVEGLHPYVSRGLLRFHRITIEERHMQRAAFG